MGLKQKLQLIKSRLLEIPFNILLVTICTCCYGFIILYSSNNANFYPLLFKQIISFLIFLPITIIIALIDIKTIYKYIYFVFIFAIILLLAVNLIGYVAMGAKRWITFFFIRIQPSELMKSGLILAIARFCHDYRRYNQTILLPILLIIVMLPSALVIKQPDLGTGIILILVGTGMIFVAGINIKYFIIGLIITLFSCPIIWNNLHDYQKNRVLTFLMPERDSLGTGYNIIQAKIAIGSGGFLGKGFLQGTQSKLHFLPAHKTDFIFATLTEELGFAGGILLISLYISLIILYYIVIISCKSIFTKLITLGAVLTLFCHSVINIGMALGLMPVVGIPLPFISYGGSMLSTMLINTGLVLNCYVNRHWRYCR